MTLQHNTAEMQGLAWEAWKAAAKAPEPAKPVALAQRRMSEAAATAIAFMMLIDPAGWWNLVALDPEQKAPLVGKTFAPGSWELIAAFIDSWNGKRNLYLTINEPLPHSRDDKLNENEIGNIRALYTDNDPEKGVPFETARRDLDRDAQSVQSAPMPPSVTVDSGGGNQMFWLLAEKVDARDGGKDRARTEGRALHNIYGGDKVHSVEHIMRLPGTINIPTPPKREAGRIERPAKILFQNARRYTLEEFERELARPSPERASGTETDPDPFIQAAFDDIDLDSARAVGSFDDLDADLKDRFKSGCAVSKRLKGLWDGDTRYLKEDKSGSGWRMCLAHELARATTVSFTSQDFTELVHVWEVITNAHDLPLREYARAWGKATAAADAAAKEREGWYAPLADADESAADWPEPIDIFGDEDPIELGEPPANSLPPILEQFARSEARRKGVSLAFAASAAVGVTAAAIGASLRVQVRQHDTGWTEPAPLWTALVAEPGRVKSPTISAATQPLKQLDGEQYRAFKVVHDAWAEADRKHKKHSSSPAPGPEPIMRRTFVDDVTIEKQVRIHADNPRGILRAPDELMGFFGSFGAYKKNGDGDRSQMLRLFDGDPVAIDRVDGGSIRADSALMGLVAGTQPDMLRKIAQGLGADGMLQRFIFVLDDGKDRKWLDEAPDERALADYRGMLRGLATATYPDAPALRMSPEAQAAFFDAANSIDGLKGLIGMPSAWRGHVEKWGRFLPRIVLTFHCVQHYSYFGSVLPSALIDVSIVETAVNFARFLLRHSMAFYRTYFDPDPVDVEARWFAGYLLTHPDITSVTHPTLYDARKKLREDGNHKFRVRIFKDLVKAGWLKIAEQGADGPARLNVNPLIHLRFKERCEWERRDREAKRRSIDRSAAAKRWLTGEERDKMSTNLGEIQ